MPRTTEAEVREVIQSNSELNVGPFITHANVWVDRINTNATNASISVTTAELTTIETYLAAHLYAIFDTQYQEEEVDDASYISMGKTEMGFDYTPWGQMAKMLDPTGTLSGSGNAIVTGFWLGKEDVAD